LIYKVNDLLYQLLTDAYTMMVPLMTTAKKTVQPVTKTPATVADAIVRSLVAVNTDTVFGIPGYQTYHLFDAFAKQSQNLRVISSRHEQGAGYMAFGYAKSTGKMGVACVVPGPGVLNASAALLTAQSTSTPLLCLTGEIPSNAIGRGFHFLHEMRDQRATLRTIAKWAERVDNPEMAVPLTQQAIYQATAGRPGVACLDLPMDLQAAPEFPARTTTSQSVARTTGAAIDPALIKAAAKALAKARQPMILVGGGAIEAAPEILELARMLGAPVVAHRAGKGIVSDRDPLGFNAVAGLKLWPEVDTIIALGTQAELPNLHWGGMESRTVIRVDIDPAEINVYGTPRIAIAGDCKAALHALLPALVSVASPVTAARLKHLADVKNAAAHAISGVQPQISYLQAIRNVLPDDGIFVDEVTQVGYTSWYGFECYRPRRFISSGYQGNLGYGLATAIGAKVANPDVPVVAISGDGGFMFNVQELATAVRERLNVVAIIFNNNLFGNVARDQDRLFNGRITGAQLANPDFPALAESFGATGMRANTPQALGKALEKAFTLDGPVVIEVPMGEYASPWPVLFPMGYASQLDRLTAGEN
jgi:acetolactate synthase-1/2/3 large subunit